MGTGVIELDGGVRIVWERVGSGAPVLLVHGITECRAMWAPVVERLAADRELVLVDLRGHGASSGGPAYDAGTLAADVAAVVTALGLDRPDVVGHSLGGIVATGVGAAGLARSVVDVDQSLQLSAFREQVLAVETLLRDPTMFPMVMAGLFQQLEGDLLPDTERARLAALRRPDQAVVLGVWQVLLELEPADVDAVVDALLGGYRSTPTPFLSLHGIDPGQGYAGWLADRVPGAVTEVWDGHGHYPQLVDPDRFVARLHEFWSA